MGFPIKSGAANSKRNARKTEKYIKDIVERAGALAFGIPVFRGYMVRIYILEFGKNFYLETFYDFSAACNYNGVPQDKNDVVVSCVFFGNDQYGIREEFSSDEELTKKLIPLMNMHFGFRQLISENDFPDAMFK